MLKKSIRVSGTGRLPRYNFGTTAANYGSSVLGYDKSKKWSDYTGAEKASTVGIGAGNAAAIGLGAAGAVITATDSNTDRFTKRDATANSLTSIGSNAASMASAGAAFGPWGAAAGLIGGSIYGAVTADSQNKKMYREQNSKDSMSDIASGYNSVANVGMASTAAYNKQVGIPGMNNGVDNFYSNGGNTPNAIIANEEAVVSNNGNVDIVGGKYNPSNPDTVLASLEDGTSILPKDKDFRLPYGKSTPADIAKKVSSIQKAGEKVMNDKSSSFIDKNTAMINRKNSDQVIDTLRMYSESIRASKGIVNTSGLPHAVYGLDYFKDLGNKLYADNVTANMNTYANNKFQYRPNEKSALSVGIPTPGLDRYINQSRLNASSGSLSNPYKKIQPGAYGTLSSAPVITSARYTYPGDIIQLDDKGNQYLADGTVIPYGDGTMRPPIEKVSAKKTTKATTNDAGASGSQKPGTNANQPTSTQQDRSINFSDVLKPVALSMALGSSLNQYRNATPETYVPSQYTFTGTKYRSNIYNQLRDIQARENIARYNNRVSSFNSANSANLNAALQYNSNNAYNSIYDANYKNIVAYDNSNLSELNRIKNLNIAESVKARDINSRSRAAARNIKYAAIQDMAKTIYPQIYTPK